MGRFDMLPNALSQELYSYESTYNTYDEPIPFCGLLIYPILLKDYNDFFIANECLILNKNKTIEGIQMTNLDFLIDKLNDPEEGSGWSWRLSKILELTFHIKNGMHCTHCHNTLSYAEYLELFKQSASNMSDLENEDSNVVVKCPKCNSIDFIQMIRYTTDEETGKHILYVDNKPITSEDFDRYRMIVMYQNLPDFYDDSKMDPYIKADYEERMRIQSKNAGKATLEKKIVCVSAATSYKIAELYDLPIRKFLMLFTAVEDKIEYQAVRTGMMSGMVTFKEPPEHWIYKKDKDVLGDVYKDLEQFKQGASY